MITEIFNREQVIAFRADVRQALRTSVFTVREQEEILIAFTELGTNIARHSRGGTLEVQLPEVAGARVRLTARNPIDRDAAVKKPGLGEGLGAVGRLMENVQIDASGGEFKVTCEKTHRERNGHGS